MNLAALGPNLEDSKILLLQANRQNKLINFGTKELQNLTSMSLFCCQNLAGSVVKLTKWQAKGPLAQPGNLTSNTHVF